MADSKQGGTDVQDVVLLGLALMVYSAGLVIHSFIIGVNVNDWWKGRPVTAVDRIVTYIEVSRMCAQSVGKVFLSLGRFSPSSLISGIALHSVDTAYVFFTSANYWFTALLFIVLCLKISIFHTGLFLYMRRVVVHRTGYFIAASLLLSSLYCCVHFWMSIAALTTEGTYNTTRRNLSTGCEYGNVLYTYTAGASFPLLSFLLSSVALFAYLYHHTRKMKMSSNLSINLETYYSVMTFVFFTFICHIIYFVGHFICILYNFIYCSGINLLPIIALDFLTALYSSYLIYRTAKLRSHMSKVLQNVIDFLSQRKDLNTTDNIQVGAQ